MAFFSTMFKLRLLIILASFIEQNWEEDPDLDFEQALKNVPYWVLGKATSQKWLAKKKRKLVASIIFCFGNILSNFTNGPKYL